MNFEPWSVTYPVDSPWHLALGVLGCVLAVVGAWTVSVWIARGVGLTVRQLRGPRQPTAMEIVKRSRR